MSDDGALIEGYEEDRPALDVACINARTHYASLVSSTGNHCQVWRSTRKRIADDSSDSHVEFVIKYPRDYFSIGDARILARHYRSLRESLGDIVPEALFVMSEIDGRPNLFVLARAVNIWFNIANPLNREEAIGLLRDHPLAWAQLKTFIAAARRWREGDNPRVIDLFGLDNLVMDNQRQIRFIDSFYVFFFEDLLHMLGGERDHDLEDKIGTSLKRLAYLEEILAFSDPEG
ncbi:MAG: hypothetical protein KDJ27_01890 [Gammaproteobacteria bacterium]|nr:hypothetical protein [Gammaproteobacteria bacterium]MCB1922494.1 hypothetical protein [Gammaproteobacteria bacterium]